MFSHNYLYFMSIFNFKSDWLKMSPRKIDYFLKSSLTANL